MKKLKKYFPILFIILVSFIIWATGLAKYFNFNEFKMHQETIEMFITNHKVLSVLIYISLYILVVSFSLPIASFMTITGGFLFGQTLGTILAVTSATSGACIFFLSAKLASSDLLNKPAGSWINKMQKGFQENAFSYLLTLRLIPLFPFAMVNLAAAIFQIPLKTFVIGTFIGIIPGAFVFTSMGVALHEVIQKADFSSSLVFDPKILIAFTGLGTLSLIPVIYKKLNKPK